MKKNILSVTKKNAPRDVFLHLLAIITLYWSAASFITLLFQYVNYFLPDPLLREYIGNALYSGPMRFAIASLLIVFPVFIFVSWFLNKNYNKDPQLREMRLRKWLIHFTLFATAIVIMGDLVRVVLIFLEGELTARFILKAASVLFVAIVVFGYYIYDVKRIGPLKNVRYFVWIVCAVVLISVVGAFFIIGSPKEERLKRFDQQRTTDLQNIQSNIVNYWQRKEKLPKNLNELKDDIAGYIVPLDPQTGASYEYNIKNSETLTFELCAVFNREGKSSSVPFMEPFPKNLQSWDHGQGRVCFDRQIDKELYPPLLMRNKWILKN